MPTASILEPERPGARVKWPGDRSVKEMAAGIELALGTEFHARYSNVNARVAAAFGVDVNRRTWYDNSNAWRSASEDLKQLWRMSDEPWKNFLKATRK